MSKTLESRLHALFFRSSALLLFFTGAAKLYSATGSALILARRDEILFITNRWLMVAAAVVEMGVAWYLIRARSDSLRALALIWLGGNFVLYRSAYTALGLGPCPCLGTLGQKLALSQATLHAILTSLVMYWFLGGLYFFWSELQKREIQGFIVQADAAAQVQDASR